MVLSEVMTGKNIFFWGGDDVVVKTKGLYMKNWLMAIVRGVL